LVKFGDKNNAFFHTQTIIRGKRKRVHRLQLPNGTWSSDSFVLHNEAQQYYKKFFSGNQPSHDPSFYNGLHPTIDEEGKNYLLNHVTKEEVSAALNSMKPYKAPGPDGLQCIFFNQYWHVVGDDIFRLVKTAFHTGYFDSAISETLIYLISKIDPPTTFKDFRPIGLSSTYLTLELDCLTSFLYMMSSFSPRQRTLSYALSLTKYIIKLVKCMILTYFYFWALIGRETN
jgi:hypothetical protein